METKDLQSSRPILAHRLNSRSHQAKGPILSMGSPLSVFGSDISSLRSLVLEIKEVSPISLFYLEELLYSKFIIRDSEEVEDIVFRVMIYGVVILNKFSWFNGESLHGIGSSFELLEGMDFLQQALY